MRNKKRITKELDNDGAVRRCAERFGLVGDPTRMKICWLLCRHPELSVGEIADVLDVSISVVSHSLKRLRAHNLVATRKEHKQVYYKLTDTPFNKILRRSFRQL